MGQNSLPSLIPEWTLSSSSLLSHDVKHTQPRRINLLAHVPEHSPAFSAVLDALIRSPELNLRWSAFLLLHSQRPSWYYGDEPGEPPVQRTDVLVNSRWCDLMFLVVEPHIISRILSGDASSDFLAIIRSWDPSKPIVMMPQMSIDEWRNPITRRQLQKIRVRMPWVQLTEPALWDLHNDLETGQPWTNAIWDWQGDKPVLDSIFQCARSCLHPSNTKRGIHPLGQSFGKLPAPGTNAKNVLPSEIWTMVFEYIGDWELARTLRIYTTLPTPQDWLPHLPVPNKPLTLEYTILTCPFSSIRSTLSSIQPTSLSPLATKLIFKFSLTKLLTYLSVDQKDVFWTSFGLTLLPHRASVQFNNPAILEWWLKSSAIIKKDYGPEALDGASRAGFVPVLDWWLNSGLPLAYTDRALESASSKGHIDVLEWWKQTSEIRSKTDSPIKLKVGKSILAAAQSGRAVTLEWWDRSGIPYSHEDGVARLASTHGHVQALQAWYELKGSKMIFDNQVLVGATKNGHADVLEWWKRSGLRVEYKTCDIEEAMEDSSVGGDKEEGVREWWEHNGLNLGVGTSEWMKVKYIHNE